MDEDLEITIIDPLSRQDKMAIEVSVVLNGEVRFCYFATPEGMKNFGDYVEGTKVRIHYNDNDFIVVSEISEEIIYSALKMLHKKNELKKCTTI